MRTVDGVVLIGVREAAELARRTPETIRRWIWSGRLSARREGNRLLVAKDAVEQLVGATDGAGDPSRTRSLRTWATDVAAGRAGRAGVTAADLIVEDRRQRSADARR